MPSPEIFTLFRARTDTGNGADLAIQEYKVRCLDFASKGSCFRYEGHQEAIQEASFCAYRIESIYGLTTGSALC